MTEPFAVVPRAILGVCIYEHSFEMDSLKVRCRDTGYILTISAEEIMEIGESPPSTPHEFMLYLCKHFLDKPHVVRKQK